MKALKRFAVTLLIMGFVAAGSTWAQTMKMPPATSGGKAEQENMQHHHGNIAPVKAEYPRMGRAQEEASGPLVTLEQVEAIARQMNPTLRQAEAGIRAARSRELQAGLYPNPTVGYTGDEIRGGSVGGGKQGFFVQQTVVTGGKLGLSRGVFSKETKLAETEAEEQKVRVESAVKLAFLRVLAAQELLDARQGLAKIAQDAAETQGRLMNTGQADETEVLQAQVEMQRMRVAARMQENTLREEWRSLAAVIGQPSLPMATVAGDLEKGWPELNEEQVLETIAKDSPAVHIAEIAKARADGLFARARKEALPDLLVRGGMEYNHETLGSVPFAKGWEGIAEVSVQLPIFNRNQGDVGAANAEIGRAEDERTRISLMLRERAASVVDQYANARLMAVEYREEILPLAKKSYGLMVDKYGRMLASYPRVLETQKKLYELQVEYIATLEGVWSNGIALQGYLLTDGLEGPARPGEMDRPVRETNVPLPERLPSTSGAMSRP
ncbi:MAG TPA: TolC family protein [Candidatus Acidoferrum sp.]|jgi:cobalt-zinc-cadmium efflux system outer membrane protein